MATRSCTRARTWRARSRTGPRVSGTGARAASRRTRDVSPIGLRRFVVHATSFAISITPTRWKRRPMRDALWRSWAWCDPSRCHPWVSDQPPRRVSSAPTLWPGARGTLGLGRRTLTWPRLPILRRESTAPLLRDLFEQPLPERRELRRIDEPRRVDEKIFFRQRYDDVERLDEHSVADVVAEERASGKRD